MNPDDRKLLEDTYELARSNHRMLRAMRNEAFLGFLVHLLIWAAVFAISYWFYQQYLAQYLGLLPSFAEMQKLLQSYQSVK